MHSSGHLTLLLLWPNVEIARKGNKLQLYTGPMNQNVKDSVVNCSSLISLTITKTTPALAATRNIM